MFEHCKLIRAESVRAVRRCTAGSQTQLSQNQSSTDKQTDRNDSDLSHSLTRSSSTGADIRVYIQQTRHFLMGKYQINAAG